MEGLMMHYELTLPKILQRMRTVFPDKEIVSQLSGQRHRYTYGDFYGRVVRLANVLRKLGVQPGDRVATFAWNSYRHMELYYAIPAVGAVLHTLNVRLAPEQLVYIVNHAEDSLIFVDASLLAPLGSLRAELKSVRGYVIMDDTGGTPDTDLTPTHEYEELMAAASDEEHFAELREEDACGLCYTSGTTGNPKGVLYSHRAIYLHSLMAAATDTFAISEKDVVLPVVPMFHANAWGMPYTAAQVGSKLVFTGADMSPQNVVSLLHEEHVTLALGVPTIWNGVLQYLREQKQGLPDVQRMLSGGAPVPLALIRAFKKEFDVEMIQGWGMTEMSPLGSTTRLLRKMDDWPEERQFNVRGQAGFAASLVEMKLLDDEDRELPWDGKSVGELLVRGPCVARAYYNNPAASAQFTADGWFRTGDVATIDENALLHITDRTKDLIKSGGEWISSVEMENAIMACPGVLEAAVVARPDPKWDERPVAFVVHQPSGVRVSAQAVIDHLAQTFAKWQLPTPEDVRFVEQIPRTSVGKFDKKVLREEFHGA